MVTDTSLDADGVALWAVLFKVPIELGTNFAATDATDPVEIEMPEDFDIAEILE